MIDIYYMTWGDFMNFKEKNYAIKTEITNRIEYCGEHINKLVKEKNIKYIILLETKGALLLDIACEKKTLPKYVQVIYPRAIRYIPPSEIASSNILLVDDIFFSGGHLNRIFKRVQAYGAKPGNILCLALLDFSSGIRDKDYFGDMHDRICKNIIPGAVLRRSETLLYLQKELLERSVPSVYDHLTIEAQGVEWDQYLSLLAIFSQQNRLLHYGQRGSYQTSSILLDDLFTGEWDVPAKARLWYNQTKKTIRITPVGFIAANNNLSFNFSDSLSEAITEAVVSILPNDKLDAKYEATVIAGRLQQLVFLKKILHDVGLKFTLENDHLNRYYPYLNIADKIKGILKKSKEQDIPTRTEVIENQAYISATASVLKLIRSTWEVQAVKCNMERVQKGHTASEIFKILKNYSTTALHAALDYCFDFHYLAVFRRKDEKGLSRCYRTTEMSEKYLPEEIYGTAIIYSMKDPTPDWLINKVLPIIRSVTPGRICDEQFVISKAYFGDITRIKQSEDLYYSWKDVQTDLWDIEPHGVGVRYKKKEELVNGKKIKNILDDTRLYGVNETLEVIIFLLQNGGRKAGVLLDILTPGYGGADYIVHNIRKMLSFGTRRSSSDITKKIQWHLKGADEKLDIIFEIFEKEDNLIDKLRRRCTRLNSSYLFQSRAEKAVEMAIPFASRLLYNALKILKGGITGAVSASNNNDFHGFSSALESIGIRSVKRNDNLKYLLSIIAQKIYPTLQAIGGHTVLWANFKNHIVSQNGKNIFVLGYDLCGERRKKVSDGEELTRIDDELHRFIANWIVAFNGKLSTAEMNAGDLRFGFFQNLTEAISASRWILHHIEQLNHTKHFPVGQEALGMVITQGNYKIDSIGNASGGILDMSGHWLKQKLQLVDEAAGKVGRRNSGLQDSQLWLLQHDAFEVDKSKRPYIKAQKRIQSESGNLSVSPIDTLEYLNLYPTPWI